MISAMKAAEIAERELARITKREIVGVTGVSPDDGKWRVAIEIIEKKSIPDAQDILSGYEVTVDEEGNVLDFMRKTMRKRGETALTEL